MAGRTDSGVHALGQIFAFTTDDPERAKKGLNPLLPLDCWITGCDEVGVDFNPRFAAISRTYQYYFGRCDLDINLMQEGARYFCGEHDFSSFAKLDGKNPVRNVISAVVSRENGYPVLTITAKSFLWRMVRCIAQALHEIGGDLRKPESIRDRLLLPGSEPIDPASAEGLVLSHVECGVGFTPVYQTKGKQYQREGCIMWQRAVSSVLFGTPDEVPIDR